MALTLINKPIGHKLSESEIEAVIIDSAGEALVYTGFAHALSDGDYVYIESNFDSYNGYKYVDSIAYDSFKIRDSENSDPVEYVQDADITYRTSVLNHGWQAVHNPIVYELESDLYPNNIAEEEYIPITIISQSEEGGLTRISLSSGISYAEELNKIKLVGSNDLEGVYQIITVYSPWDFVIDLPYDVANSFSSLQVVRWYDNYSVNVMVIAGLSSLHRWESVKPYEVAATLQFIPDNEGKIKFSISEILRAYINTRNNLTLDTLPNNLDFMVSFYIQYFESYDQSDGVEITTFEGDVTTDDFVGYAVNAMMPFKNESISHMSDYINEDVYLARWLTLQDRSIAIVGRFFDLSFINQFLGSDIIISINGVDTLTIENPGYGIIRVPITPQSGDTEICVQASTNGAPEIPGTPEIPAIPPETIPITLPDLDEGENIAYDISAGPSSPWTLGATPTLSLTGTVDNNSDIWANDYPFIEGYTYDITPDIDYDFDTSNTNGEIIFVVLNSVDDIIYTESFPFVGDVSGTLSTVITFVAGFDYVKYGFYCISDGIGSRTDTFQINSLTATQTDIGTPGVPGTPSIPAIPAQVITEEICIDIVEECESTFIPEPDEIRLTEDGDFRILE